MIQGAYDGKLQLISSLDKLSQISAINQAPSLSMPRDKFVGGGEVGSSSASGPKSKPKREPVKK